MLPAVSGPTAAGPDAYRVPQPRRGEVDELVWESLCFATPAGYRPLFLDLHVPRPSAARSDTATGAPLVVWLHGGGWEQGSRRRFPVPFEEHWMLERILLAGLAVALVDYRLVREAPFPAPVDDVHEALAWLRAHARDLDLDPDRIALWGESAGAHIALLAVADAGRRQAPQVRAVVDWYGPTDLPGLMRSRQVGAATQAEQAAEADLGRVMYDGGWGSVSASPLLVLDGRTPPLFIAHGRDDETVPLSQSVVLRDRMVELGAPVELMETGGGHVFEGADVLPEVLSRSLDFLCGSLDVKRGPHPDVTRAPATARAAASSRAVGEDMALDVADRQVPVRVLRAVEEADTVVVHLIGAASGMSALDRHRAHAERILAVVPATVVQVACGPGPSSVENGVAAAVWARDSLASPGSRRLVIAADDAGGSLAVATARRCRDVGVNVDALFLDQGLRPDGVALPGPSDLRGLGPVLVGAGALDPSFEHSLTLVRRLREADVPTRLRIFPGLGNGYAGGAPGLLAAERASQQMCRDLSQYVWDRTLG